MLRNKKYKIKYLFKLDLLLNFNLEQNKQDEIKAKEIIRRSKKGSGINPRQKVWKKIM